MIELCRREQWSKELQPRVETFAGEMLQTVWHGGTGGVLWQAVASCAECRQAAQGSCACIGIGSHPPWWRDGTADSAEVCVWECRSWISVPFSHALSLSFWYNEAWGQWLRLRVDPWLILLGRIQARKQKLLEVFYLFIFRERGKEGERNISVWLPLTHPLLGPWPTTHMPVCPD